MPLPSSSPRRTTPLAPGQTGRAPRRASLEQLDDAGQTAGDVLAGDATGVERPHRQLGAGLTDRLGGDDADRLAELDALAGGERTAVARGAHAELGVAGEHGAHLDPVDTGIVAQLRHLVVADDGVPRQHRAVGQRDVLQQRPAEQARVEVRLRGRRVGVDILDPDAQRRLAVVLADDQLLGDVDEAAGQVARVGGAQARCRRGPCGRPAWR